MPGDVTNVLMESMGARVDAVEKKIEQYDANIQNFYRNEWSKIDVMSTQMATLIGHIAEDKAEHKALEARVLKCETQILALRTELLQSLGEIEKKFLKWVAVSAAISGGAGASVLKMLSLFG